MTHSWKFREILTKFHQNRAENRRISAKFLQNLKETLKNYPKITKKLMKFRQNFESGAVRRNVNLEDLEKRCKMSIWLLS